MESGEDDCGTLFSGTYIDRKSVKTHSMFSLEETLSRIGVRTLHGPHQLDKRGHGDDMMGNGIHPGKSSQRSIPTVWSCKRGRIQGKGKFMVTTHTAEKSTKTVLASFFSRTWASKIF